MKFVNPNDPDQRIQEIKELRDKITNNLLEMMEEKEVHADILLNALVNVVVRMAFVCADGDNDRLMKIANELRYSIVSQIVKTD